MNVCLLWLTPVFKRLSYADTENTLVDTVWEGESGVTRESDIDIDTLSRVKWSARETLLYNTGSPAWLSVMT